MEDKEREQIKSTLMQMRKELTQGVINSCAASLELGQDGVPDIGDMSSNAYSREVLLNLSESQRLRIRDIDAALDRLAAGEYGICVRCEEEIAPRRLEVRPFSRYCVDCKSDVEKFGE